jgi:hypothetical protein
MLAAVGVIQLAVGTRRLGRRVPATVAPVAGSAA